MKHWRQWPWKQWGKMYLIYLALWLAFDLFLLGIGEGKSLSNILMAAPGKALMFLVIFDVVNWPKTIRSKNKNIVAADSANKSTTGHGETIE